MLWLIIGWIKVKRKQSIWAVDSFASVVVAVRNEETTLPNLIQSLAQQTYPKDKFEIILVNDHSTDKTAEIISKLINQYHGMKVSKVSAQDLGKKRAITEGIESARGEIILTTDADCTLPTNWIAGMVGSFTEETQLVIGAVKIKTDQRFFSTLQAMEFSSVMGSGMAMMGWGQAVMCNGASLAFRKRAFDAVRGYEGNFEIPSGDDEFLMRKIDHHYPGGITVVSQKDCVVETAPLYSIKDFVQQRLRWAGKWKANDSIFAKALAVFILSVQISWPIIIVAASLLYSKTLGLTILLKILLEITFLLMVSIYLKQRFRILAFSVLQIVYPFYVIWIGFYSQISTYTWKGRSS
ncbi:MAG: glycosyltransferase [Cyclobacteriaceae bacterium]|nr:glycosyltransferase [Cyclobacteriaceae bacterium]